MSLPEAYGSTAAVSGENFTGVKAPRGGHARPTPARGGVVGARRDSSATAPTFALEHRARRRTPSPPRPDGGPQGRRFLFHRTLWRGPTALQPGFRRMAGSIFPRSRGRGRGLTRLRRLGGGGVADLP